MVRSDVDPRFVLEVVRRVFPGDLMTSHIRHFHGFTLTTQTPTHMAACRAGSNDLLSVCDENWLLLS